VQYRLAPPKVAAPNPAVEVNEGGREYPDHSVPDDQGQELTVAEQIGSSASGLRPVGNDLCDPDKQINDVM